MKAPKTAAPADEGQQPLPLGASGRAPRRVSSWEVPRALLNPSKPALLFAYGSNLDARQMAHRVPGSSPVGVAVLLHHRLDFVGWSLTWDGGVATVTPVDCDPDLGRVPPELVRVPRVEGLLWRLPEGGLDAMDSFEGHPTVYERTRMVLDMPGGTVLGWVYRHRRPILAPPSKAYREAILGGAAAFRVGTAQVREAEKRARRLHGVIAGSSEEALEASLGKRRDLSKGR